MCIRDSLYAAQFARDRAGDRPCTDFCYEAVCLTSCPNYEHRRRLVWRLYERSQLGIVGLSLPRIVKQTAIARTVQQALTAREERLGRIRAGCREVHGAVRTSGAVLPEDRYQANRAAADLADSLQDRDPDNPDEETVQAAIAELARDLSVPLQPRETPQPEDQLDQEGAGEEGREEDGEADQGGEGQGEEGGEAQI